MRVTQVSIRPTEAAEQAGRPALTPELLAATGARYSRNNEGLEAILSKIDPGSLDKSVDSIFRMIDYGHQSIADMATVAMFIDGISLWLAYYVWSVCPTAGGQESSTRYIKLGEEGLSDPDLIGIRREDRAEWLALMHDCFAAYQEALAFWESYAAEHPEAVRVPAALRADDSEKAQKQIARIRRNFGFDRARYFLPVASTTNMMLVMSARGWVQLSQHLLSHPAPEAVALGEHVVKELSLAAPRLLKHAVRDETYACGLRLELDSWVQDARCRLSALGNTESLYECPATPHLRVDLPAGVNENDLVAALQTHKHRYAYTGSAVQRSFVRFGWDAVCFAEIRDLNRHRTGSKYCPLTPVGFYCADDQARQTTLGGTLAGIRPTGSRASATSLRRLAEDEVPFFYWGVLGSQVRFEHSTTMDKFIYEAELRTGTGAHYRYAAHFSRLVAMLSAMFGDVGAAINEGLGEPE